MRTPCSSTTVPLNNGARGSTTQDTSVAAGGPTFTANENAPRLASSAGMGKEPGISWGRFEFGASATADANASRAPKWSAVISITTAPR